MTEKRLWDTLKDGLDHAGHLDRIESHATSQGRPDVNYCIEGCMGDIELKIYDRKKGGFVLRANQNAWMQNRTRHSGRCFILARHDGDQGQKTYLLIEGRKSRALIHERGYFVWAAQAKVIWTDKINFSELKALLKGTGADQASPN